MIRLIIVIAAAIQRQCQDIAVALTGNPADNKVWEVGLSADGNLPTTHYWCGWRMKYSLAEKLKTELAKYIDSGQVKMYNQREDTDVLDSRVKNFIPSKVDMPDQVLADKNLKTQKLTL